MAVQIDTMKGVAFSSAGKCEEHFHCGIYIMVGDDYRHHVDLHDVKPLNEEDYCGGCGQIGCEG